MSYNFTKKNIQVNIRLEKVDLGEVYIQKEQENFKIHSSSNTIGGPLHMSHPVFSSSNGCCNENKLYNQHPKFC